VRDGVDVVVNLGIALDLGEVIAFVIEFIEGNAQSPEVRAAQAGDGFLGQRLGAAVKTARRPAKAEVGLVGLGVTANGLRIFFDQTLQTPVWSGPFHARLAVLDDFGARIDATGGDMAPRDVGGVAGVGNGQRQQRIALQRIGARGFAGVHVRFAGVTGGVDEKIGFGFAQTIEQHIEPGIIDLAAREGGERAAALLQRREEGLAM